MNIEHLFFGNTVIGWGCEHHPFTKHTRPLYITETAIGHKITITIRLETPCLVDVICVYGNKIVITERHGDEGHGDITHSMEHEAFAYRGKLCDAFGYKYYMNDAHAKKSKLDQRVVEVICVLTCLEPNAPGQPRLADDQRRECGQCGGAGTFPEHLGPMKQLHYCRCEAGQQQKVRDRGKLFCRCRFCDTVNATADRTAATTGTVRPIVGISNTKEKI